MGTGQEQARTNDRTPRVHQIKATEVVILALEAVKTIFGDQEDQTDGEGQDLAYEEPDEADGIFD
jgi:hypothetical protein